MSKLVVFPNSPAHVDEPDWSMLIPDPESAENGNSPLRQRAASEWRQLVAAMRSAGTLAPENRHQMQRLVLAYIRYDQASAALFAGGMIVEAPGSFTAATNIWRTAMRQADEDASRAEAELGISPRRRGSAKKASKPARSGSRAETYLTDPGRGA